MGVLVRTGRTIQGSGLAQREEDDDEIAFKETLRSLRIDSNLENYGYYVKNLSQINLNSTKKGFSFATTEGTLQFFEIPTQEQDIGKYLSQEGVSAQMSWSYNKDVNVNMQNSISIANFGSTRQTYMDISGNQLSIEKHGSLTSPQEEQVKEFNTITLKSDITDTTFTYLVELKRP